MDDDEMMEIGMAEVARRLHVVTMQRNELLEALEAFVVKHRQTYGIDGAWDEEIVKAEAAIAKAKGEQ